MIDREISKKAIELFQLYPILAITGPRQSGKTTLVKELFKDIDYVSLEDLDQREIANYDPRGFLMNYPNGAIIDEIQRVPSLFNYLQTRVDEINKVGQFIILGSQNFLLMESISQSLAGRVALIKLLPLSQKELKKANLLPEESNDIMFNGNYPAIYSRNIPANIFYPNYLSTYIERDVRTLKNIGNLNIFTLFVQLCAGRIGQPLNYSSLASDTGIAVNTAKEWISILESSYIIFLIKPHHKNFNKRLVKMPKLYFYDTGLITYLLNIEHAAQIQNHYLLGNIFENYAVSELIKNRYNKGLKSNLYYWKDNKGKEVDIIIDNIDQTIAIEIKASQTYNLNAFDNINYYRKISSSSVDSYVISRVNKNKELSNESFISWNNISFE